MTSFFGRIKEALTKTSSKISTGLTSIFLNRKLDEDTIEDLHDLLISADMGASASEHIIDQIKKIRFEKDVEVKVVQQKMAEIISGIINENQKPFELEDGLNIILVCGVNGNGKTTTIGKLASKYKEMGKKVMVAACDTYRAAAISQLKVWTDRAGVEIIEGPEKSDPASVAFKASAYAKEKGADILFIDTAGRLQNQQNLMDELGKIKRVIEKASETSPKHNILVLDATTGQNAFSQAEQFKEIADVNGLIITKLDGSAKAGTIVGLSDKYKLPVYFIGLGEKIEDLKEFEVSDFANALVGLENG